MKKILLPALFIILVIFSCEDFFIASSPIGHLNPDDPETTADITGVPEINVYTVVNSSSVNILSTGSYSFADTTEAGQTRDAIFKIENLSSDTDLQLTGSSIVAISGTDSSQFSISQQPAASVAAGSETQFTLSFEPTTTGDKSAVLTIANNDSTESAYIINITATAVAATYNPTVTFDVQGGSAASPSAITVTYGSPYGTLPTTSRSGYSFAGWFTAVSGGTEVTAATIVTEGSDHTLYAHWSGDSYTVIFDAQGGSTPSSISVTYGTSYGTLPSTSLENYTFNGWFTAASGGTQVTVDTIVTTNSDHTLYAQWTGNSYTVSFDPNGGSTPDPASISVTYGSAYGTLATTTLTGYTLDGWFTAASGGTQVTPATTVTDASNHTLYAQWSVSIYVGTPLADDFASSAITITTDSYLAPRNAADAAITVGGNITVQSGATLTIYEGVTLDMGSSTLTVDGNLDVAGTDAQRVKFTGSGWGGIIINGTATINGAVIGDFYSSSAYGLNLAGGSVTVTNSRITHTGTSVGIRISAPDNNADFIFQNNIFNCVPSSGNMRALDFYNFSASGVTADISYNTFIGKGSSGYAIYVSGTSATYTIERNIIANGSTTPYYSAGIYFSSVTPVVSTINNIFDDRGTTRNLLDGNAADTDTGNLEYVDWVNSVIFTNFDSNEFTMLQTSTYPDLVQANDIVEMEGCLTAGNMYENGAYGNGGYPPLYNE